VSTVVCDWNFEGGATGEIQRIIEMLIGRSVLSATVDPPACDLRLSFAGGLTLVVFADRTDEREDAWFILGSDGAEAGAVVPWSE
jgi:hypothetical protein